MNVEVDRKKRVSSSSEKSEGRVSLDERRVGVATVLPRKSRMESNYFRSEIFSRSSVQTSASYATDLIFRGVKM